MKKATVRDLRYNFPKLERALRAGQEIEITKRKEVIGRLIPAHKPPARPDFVARMNEIFGDRVLEPSNVELLRWDRDDR